MQDCECDEKQKAREKLAQATGNVTGTGVTPIAEAKRFIVDCLKAVGTNEENAEIVADNLITADYRGVYSHGMNRLDRYINDVKQQLCNPNGVPKIEKETVSTAVVDGNNAFGAVIGKFCMATALKKAKETGIGLVVAHGSNHYGVSAVYTLQAINEGCIGMAFTNTSPWLVPTRAKDAALGTNPVALGAPGLGGDSFVLDIAVTAVSAGQIEIRRRKGEPIPEGWAMNENGQVETDADKAIKAKRLMPLGGTEQNSGYKGYGLAMMVEILSGIISGAAYGPNVRKWQDGGKVANLGQSFFAIDPKQLVPGFEDRLNDLMNIIRQMAPVDPNRPVFVHGDLERLNMEKANANGGLTYVQDQHETNAKLAAELNVRPMTSR